MEALLGPCLRNVARDARILVVGCGGIGCEFLKAVSGYRLELTLVDFDTIEPSNLHRQFLYSAADVGRHKAEVAAHSLRTRNADLRVSAYVKSIFSAEFDLRFFAGFDAAVLALDNEEARAHVNRACVRSRTPLIECGTHGFAGQCYAIFPRLSRCYDCHPRLAPRVHQICSVRSRPTQPVHCALWARQTLDALLSPAVSDDLALYPSLRGAACAAVAAALESIFGSALSQFSAVADGLEVRALDVPALLGGAGGDAGADLRYVADYLTLRREARDWCFDKDCEEDVEALEALTRLRAACFGVEGLRRGDGRRLALNVIPAISSTNALVAGLAALELFKYLLKRRLAADADDETRLALAHKEIYVSCLGEPRITTAYLAPPVADCAACGAETLALRLDFATRVADLLRALEARLDGEVTLLLGAGLIAGPEDPPTADTIAEVAGERTALPLLALVERGEVTSRVQVELEHELGVCPPREEGRAAGSYEAVIAQELELVARRKGRKRIARAGSPLQKGELVVDINESRESVLLASVEWAKRRSASPAALKC